MGRAENDSQSDDHQRRVADIACAIADKIGLSEEDIHRIRIAALVHDIGKIGVPVEVLGKPARLAEIEFDIVKDHAKTGYKMCKDIRFPLAIAQIVLEHHERMDGSGYPQGLSGEDISLEARILAVADVVDAMVSQRPYRIAHGIDEALQEIAQNRGTLYDPRVVDACLKLLEEKRLMSESGDS